MSRKATVNVNYHLFEIFCMNLCGSLFWDLTSEKETSFYTLWCKCLRKFMDLPYTTHSRYIPVIVNGMPVESIRVNNFMCSISARINSCEKLN